MVCGTGDWYVNNERQFADTDFDIPATALFMSWITLVLAHHRHLDDNC